MKLILIRHGRTAANDNRLYCGSTDIGLSQEGIRELKEYKAAGRFPDCTGMRILTSGMKRCEATLRLLYGTAAHEADPDFRETDFGVFEMRSYEELKADPAYIAWISGDNETNIPPGGESGSQTAQRVHRGLARLICDGRDALLITHGGIIALIMAELFPDQHKTRYEWQPPCGGGYIVCLGEHRCSTL